MSIPWSQTLQQACRQLGVCGPDAARRQAAAQATDALHNLCHTFGTPMAAAGVAMRTLQGRMGPPRFQDDSDLRDYALSA
jgi:hypothetical protein